MKNRYAQKGNGFERFALILVVYYQQAKIRKRRFANSLRASFYPKRLANKMKSLQ